MVIRGNTVGTTMSVEKIAEKIGGTGGGVPVLSVDIRSRYDEDFERYVASHGSGQIVEHLNKGGTVVGVVTASTGVVLTLPLSGIFDYDGVLCAHFQWVGGARYTNFEIKPDGRVFETVVTSATTDDIGAISTALDELHAYAQEYSGVIVAPDETQEIVDPLPGLGGDLE